MSPTEKLAINLTEDPNYFRGYLGPEGQLNYDRINALLSPIGFIMPTLRESPTWERTRVIDGRRLKETIIEEKFGSWATRRDVTVDRTKDSSHLKYSIQVLLENPKSDGSNRQVIEHWVYDMSSIRSRIFFERCVF